MRVGFIEGLTKPTSRADPAGEGELSRIQTQGFANQLGRPVPLSDQLPAPNESGDGADSSRRESEEPGQHGDSLGQRDACVSQLERLDRNHRAIRHQLGADPLDRESIQDVPLGDDVQLLGLKIFKEMFFLTIWPEVIWMYHRRNSFTTVSPRFKTRLPILVRPGNRWMMPLLPPSS